MIYIAYTIHVVVCLFLILVVLLQQGKGADLSVFGGGSTQSAFGARGAATLLHKLTVAGFVAFILTTVGIGFLQSERGGSVMSTVSEEGAPAAEAGPFEAEPETAGPETAPVDPAATDEGQADGEAEQAVDAPAEDPTGQPEPPDTQ